MNETKIPCMQAHAHMHCTAMHSPSKETSLFFPSLKRRIEQHASFFCRNDGTHILQYMYKKIIFT